MGKIAKFLTKSDQKVYEIIRHKADNVIGRMVYFEQTEIAIRAEITRMTVHRSIKKMVSIGLIGKESKKIGMVCRFYLIKDIVTPEGIDHSINHNRSCISTQKRPIKHNNITQKLLLLINDRKNNKKLKKLWKKAIFSIRKFLKKKMKIKPRNIPSFHIKKASFQKKNIYKKLLWFLLDDP